MFDLSLLWWHHVLLPGWCYSLGLHCRSFFNPIILRQISFWESLPAKGWKSGLRWYWTSSCGGIEWWFTSDQECSFFTFGNNMRTQALVSSYHKCWTALEKTDNNIFTFCDIYCNMKTIQEFSVILMSDKLQTSLKFRFLETATSALLNDKNCRLTLEFEWKNQLSCNQSWQMRILWVTMCDLKMWKHCFANV